MTRATATELFGDEFGAVKVTFLGWGLCLSPCIPRACPAMESFLPSGHSSPNYHSIQMSQINHFIIQIQVD